MAKKKQIANKMWGGHFDEAADGLLIAINESISFDWQLYKQDIAASIVHAQMLAKQKIITQKDCKAIEKGLKQIEGEIEQGKFKFKLELEDIHMNIEARLAELVGDAAGRLHTARSRNDQVATDFKLWVRDCIDTQVKELQNFQKILNAAARKYGKAIMPGFTHLQVAQPVTLAHHLKAYTQMIERDISRFKDCRKRLNECPLGAAALAGTGFNIDRKYTSRNLKFDRPTANSLDSVSDRDFSIEYLSCASMVSMHLSRLAEEMIIWSSAQFSFIKLSDKFTTGSSIMPQKRNPDAAELVRGKSGRIYGNLLSLLTTMKALPLAYNKDSQEDKEPVFDTARNLSLCINAMAGMVKDMQVDKKAMKIAAASGYSTATDIADWLVREANIPFRNAHHITGKIVKLAEGKNCRLDELALKDMQAIEPKISKKIFDVLSVEASVVSRKSYGGAGGK